jgi:enolase
MTTEAVISRLRALQILDSRGRPTLECEVVLTDGTVANASVPSGASTGRHEAHELRDRHLPDYRGMSVATAVRNVDTTINEALVGMSPFDQHGVDNRLIETDGTVDKSVLGANSMLGASIAVARAASLSAKKPLYEHLGELAGVAEMTIPMPMINLVSGGAHARGSIDIQDVLIIPWSARTFSEALATAVEAYRRLEDRLESISHVRLVADEGGWTAPGSTNAEAIGWVHETVSELDTESCLAVDVASTQLRTNDGRYRFDGRVVDHLFLNEQYRSWVENYKVWSIEDAFGEDDWDQWHRLNLEIGDRCQLLGDDLFTTNPGRIAINERAAAANAVLIKPNQIGTISETLDAIGAAHSAGLRCVVSARSGDTEDAFIADLAVGTAVGQIKVGSVTRSERLAKWNRLASIERDLGEGSFAGPLGPHMRR